ncbi:MAG: YncE family protein [Proteobacteria bacterium]|nr:YncE family protein [Pseudomonadota bacterium]
MIHRKFVLAFLTLVTLAAAGSGSATGTGNYRVLAHYPVGGHETGYDYLRVDPTNHRLFIAHSTRVEVLDADTGTRVGEISGTPGVHGIAFAPEFGHGFTSNGLARTVTMFDLKTLKPLAEIKYTGVKPDAIEYDPQTRQVFVVNGGETGDISIIAADSGAIVGTVAVGGGKLEGLQFDGQGRGFVNDEEKSAIHVFDVRKRVAIATWSVAPGEEPTGLAFDRQRHRLFAACANNKLIVLDSNSGKVVATPAIGADPDGAAFDPKTQRVFTSNSDGTVSIVDASAADRYPLLETVKTGEGARTIALDERTGRIYLPTAKFAPSSAASATGSHARPQMIPGSFGVLVVGR